MKKNSEICLALDTALEACSVALAIRDKDELLTFGRSLALGRGHAEHLMNELETLLDEAEIGYDQLDRIAVTIGPGSFTGLRVGLATARALGLALDIPVIGASSLLALALSAWKEGHRGTVASFIDARRGQIYGQFFSLADERSGIESLSEACAKSADAFAQDCLDATQLRLIGSGSELVLGSEKAGPLAQQQIIMTRYPDMEQLAVWALDQTAPLRPPSPLYLRDPDAKPQASKAIARL
ncbi:tRNA (adenosine(37)-N6)-threonylcarbamoyltransferase complex dimerization subunit type 1 TsaB [uncultured Cohaesibacter sp.]|uniref:tRNA (adenosine(37)-N6)-threonylcarbamoyltransferase complex dimerization subunit type 1 TsaB n=1 Tax=uncultured Cohaesibacter sp. TaxID=1002546 RepID=UPI002930AB93|nr:tRNA (adenosine(37)-N6)-threonylcarbamoyltransferase complex dimerization subunit type 1 TsaB [uncultured Cohaesibacter sp.]